MNDINTEAKEVKDIFTNPDITVDNLIISELPEKEQKIDKIFCIYLNGDKLPWYIKTYPKEKIALLEAETLKRLEKYDFVPKLLIGQYNKHLCFNIISAIEGLDLFAFTCKYGYFTEKSVKPFVIKILSIVNVLHSHGIIHKDIKPDNIIYNKDTDKIYLIDFEGSRYTEDFCSPEKFNHRTITTKHDMWSLGVTIYSLASGFMPFNKKYDILHGKLKLFREWSRDFKDFIGCLLERDVDLRYSVEDIMHHEWLN